MLYAGIDPGAKGAMAILDPAGNPLKVVDLPLIEDKNTCWVDGSELTSKIRELNISNGITFAVERVASMPRQGVSSTFKFGCNFGSILGALRVLQFPIELITPTTWKKHFQLDSDKKAALHKARMMFPTAELHLEKHEGRAEALLLAYYLRHKNMYR